MSPLALASAALIPLACLCLPRIAIEAGRLVAREPIPFGILVGFIAALWGRV